MAWQAIIKKKTSLPRKFSPLSEGFAEFLGTFVLIVFGCGSVAQNVLGEKTYGSYLSVNLSWGIAVTMGVYISAGVSGGHINPAVTTTMVILGRLRWWRMFIFILCQYLGAIAGSAVVYGVYKEALHDFDGGKRNTTGPLATAGIWATYPRHYVEWYTGLGDQILSTGLLMMCILAITDAKNQGAPKGMAPFVIGFVVMVIGMSFGLNCGYAINPARDLGPRIFTAMAGWGTDVFSYRNYNWFWIPIVGPHIGALLGAWTYLIFVGNHVKDEEEEERIELQMVGGPEEYKGDINGAYL